MSKFYKSMPQDFKDAINVIKEYCQNEDCDCTDCNECEVPLGIIRKGDNVAYNECGNMENFYINK